MITRILQAACLNTSSGRIAACLSARLLLGLLLFARPVRAQSQFDYTTRNGAITITRYNCDAGAAVIPGSIQGRVVTTLGQQAFSGCPGLTNVTIPNTVTTIENEAFYGCAGLTSVTIPNSVTSIGLQAFAYCKGLTSVTIPKSATNIGWYAFEGCTSLISVEFENGITAIPPGMLLRCTGLTSVTIPNSVTSLGVLAFSGCTDLKAIEVKALNPAYSSVDGVLFDKVRTTLIQCPGGKDGVYTLPNSVTTLGDHAFSGCTGLTSVTIPNSVTSIGYNSFSSCTGLTNVTIPNSVTTLGDYAFSGCTGLSSVTIPNSVTSIRGGVFSHCTSLTGMTIPNSVTNLGGHAFAGCHDLTTVTIPSSITSIGYRAFYSCVNLGSVYFQGNVPKSDDDVFEDSEGLTVYYLAGTSGWGTTYEGRPTALWSQPLILVNDPGFGVSAGGFGFTISWAPNASVVVEASPGLTQPIWSPLSTNTLADGSSRFTDPQWNDHPFRLYRVVPHGDEHDFVGRMTRETETIDLRYKGRSAGVNDFQAHALSPLLRVGESAYSIDSHTDPSPKGRRQPELNLRPNETRRP